MVLTGDLTDLGKPAEAERLAEIVRAASLPVVGVFGNHDHESDQIGEVKDILCRAGLKLLDGSSVEIGGVGFVGAKGFAGGFGRRMLGSFGEAAIKSFVAESVREANGDRERLARGAHPQGGRGAALRADRGDGLEGEPPEIFPFLGSSRLAETIDRFEVAAIVHGHAHRGTFEGRTPKGTPVYNVAWAIEKPTGRPYALLEI